MANIQKKREIKKYLTLINVNQYSNALFLAINDS
jgi:hypothetical protein